MKDGLLKPKGSMMMPKFKMGNENFAAPPSPRYGMKAKGSMMLPKMKMGGGLGGPGGSFMASPKAKGSMMMSPRPKGSMMLPKMKMGGMEGSKGSMMMSPGVGKAGNMMSPSGYGMGYPKGGKAKMFHTKKMSSDLEGQYKIVAPTKNVSSLKTGPATQQQQLLSKSSLRSDMAGMGLHRVEEEQELSDDQTRQYQEDQRLSQQVDEIEDDGDEEYAIGADTYGYAEDKGYRIDEEEGDEDFQYGGKVEQWLRSNQMNFSKHEAATQTTPRLREMRRFYRAKRRTEEEEKAALSRLECLPVVFGDQTPPSRKPRLDSGYGLHRLPLCRPPFLINCNPPLLVVNIPAEDYHLGGTGDVRDMPRPLSYTSKKRHKRIAPLYGNGTFENLLMDALDDYPLSEVVGGRYPAGSYYDNLMLDRLKRRLASRMQFTKGAH